MFSRSLSYALVVLLFVSLLIGLTLPANAMDYYNPHYDSDEVESINVYERASKAVVTINALINGTPSSGSGVVIHESGIILTSGHVIGNATKVYISTADGQKATGQVVGRTGDRSDLALIKVNTGGTKLDYLPLADSTKVKVGQKVLAIGNPYGFERTLTRGIISRIDKERNYLQTDAAINPGNSGGPLLDTQGYIIGINVTIYNPNKISLGYNQGRFIDRTNIGIGFAVPVNTVKSFLKKLADQRPIPATVASISKSPIVRYAQTEREGYENVSIVLDNLKNSF